MQYIIFTDTDYFIKAENRVSVMDIYRVTKKKRKRKERKKKRKKRKREKEINIV